MSQLARRENAPHRAAFVTSLSRWYIRRLLGNLPPFHPCLSAESEAPFCPLRNIVTLRAYSLEIKVRQAISVFLSVYPELVGVVGSRVPDYRGRFLRGVSSGHSVGQTVANSIKSHNHTQPTHTHSFSGQLVSTALSGTATGQKYSSSVNLTVSGTAAGQRYLDRRMEAARTPISGSGGGTAAATYGGEGVNYFFSADNAYLTANSSSISGTARGTVSGTANASTVSGNLRNGTVTGTIAAGGGNPTDYTGEAETAPDHIYVRCLIRAKP